MTLRVLAAVAVLGVFAAVARTQARPPDLSSKVNVFIGTARSPDDDYGLTMPAAAMPFGMIQWGPDPIGGQFYRYDLADTRGFSLTHLSGVGCGMFGDVPIMPVEGAVTTTPAQNPIAFGSRYKHTDEAASPGFYSVKLDSGIGVQLAAGLRAGLGTFTFPASGKPHSLIVDLSRTQNRFGIKDAELHAEGQEVTGSIRSGGFCMKANDYRIYFALESEEAPASVGTFDALTVDSTPRRSGTHNGAVLTFAAATREVHIRVGLSYISADAARANLHAELSAYDFAALRRQGTALWNEHLSRAEVFGGAPAQQRVYYTALYHSLLHPSLFSDADGRYLGFDDKIHTLPAGHRQFANFSSWDTYRSQVQLVAMLFPEIASDLAQSLVNDAKEGGGFPRWPAANDDTEVMVGDPSDPILAEIYDFGARDFDTKAALALMIRGADDPAIHARLYAQRPALAEYLAKGYVSETPNSQGSASITLEYANDDFAISRFAAAMGDDANAKRFLDRSANWRKVFDSDTKYIRPRDTSGKFLAPFDPASSKGFVEGNAAQYTWMTPYDFPGVIAALGGDAAANARLDAYFSEYGRFNGGPYFLISNEPSFSNPWIYNWTGEPWRTQVLVTKVLHDLFTDTPGGLPGNDDMGATSAWGVFSLLGIFPAVPGVAGFTLNTPTFPEARVRIAGHTLTIKTEGSGPYLASVSLGATPVNDYWISWQQLTPADTLTFGLATDHGATTKERPPSFSKLK